MDLDNHKRWKDDLKYKDDQNFMEKKMVITFLAPVIRKAVLTHHPFTITHLAANQ
jgi:hypothetical protein